MKKILKSSVLLCLNLDGVLLNSRIESTYNVNKLIDIAFMRYFLFSLLLLPILLLTQGCERNSPMDESATQKVEITIYSGITMVKPLSILAAEFEKQENVVVHIEQGASGYVYKTVRSEKTGDIFFPGSESYRKTYAADGILLDRVFVGYNRLALLVKEGNPKQLTSDIKQLMDPNISVVLASPDSSAVGQATSKLLKSENICDLVFNNVTYFTTDSHRLLTSLQNGEANLIMNWYATSIWEENADSVDAIRLPDNVEIKNRLELNLLKYSKQPEIARKFMAFASSKHGLETFAEYGFLTADELALVTANPASFAE